MRQKVSSMNVLFQRFRHASRIRAEAICFHKFFFLFFRLVAAIWKLCLMKQFIKRICSRNFIFCTFRTCTPFVAYLFDATSSSNTLNDLQPIFLFFVFFLCFGGENDYNLASIVYEIETTRATYMCTKYVRSDRRMDVFTSVFDMVERR